MIHVDCPSCNAPYELDERRLPKGGMQMRCPKCGTSFPVKPPGAADVAAPAAPKIAAPAPAPARRPPLAPPFPAVPKPPPPVASAPDDLDELDGLDLPMPKRAGAALELDALDLPVPKRPGAAAAPPELLDLPAPKRSGLALEGLDELDLPAPKGAAARPAAAKPSPPAQTSGLGRPAPAIAAPIVDLPAPKAAPGGPPKRPIPMPAPGFAELDLPAPEVAGAKPQPRPFDDLELDLPAPKVAGAKPQPRPFDDFELDLPAPKAPAAKSSGNAFDDLELDLPAPLVADLPARRGGALDDLDLPAPVAADLPARRGGALDDLDLPAPVAADLPAPRDLPAVRRNPFDDLLGETPSLDGAGAGGARDPGLPTPDSFPPPPRVPRAASGGFGLDVPPPRSVAPVLDDADDDLALPEPRARGASAASPEVRKDAGGTAFGELDLGAGGPDEELEFAGLAEEETAPEASEAFEDLPDPAAAVVAPPMQGPASVAPKQSRAKAPKRKSARSGRMVVAFAGILAVVVGGGAALHFTPYGLFGVYLAEGFLPAAGSEAEARRVIARAEERAAPDTYADARAALRELAEARRVTGLNRSLLVRSLVHEALFQARFGADAGSAARAARIFARLEERAALVPEMALARAADELRRGAAMPSLAEARRAAPNDAYVELLAGEGALGRGAGEEARDAFRAALAHGGGARAQWGLARAAILLGDESREAAVDATLAASPGHVAALAAKAELMLERGRADEAVAIARRAAGLDPGEEGPTSGARRERAAAFAVLGRAEEARSHRASAREAYERALALDSYRVDALVGAGRVLLAEGQARDALGRYEAAIEVLAQPGPAASAALVRDAKLGRVEALLRLDRPADARAALEVLATDTPDDSDVALWRGRALAALGESDAAVTELRRAITLAPDRFEPYMALAQHFFAADDPARAAEALRAAQAHVEPTAEVHRLLGESLIRRNELVAAKEELLRALALDAEDRGALFGLGVVERRSGRLDEAERSLDRLAALDPAYPGLSLERASIYEARGQSERAALALERALERSPGDAELELRLAAAQVSAGQLDRADATLARLLAAESPSAMAFYYRGRVAFARGQLGQAIERFRRAIMLDGERAEFHVYLAWAYFEHGNLAGASEEVTTALRLDEGIGDAYLIRARIAVRTGRVRDAVEDAERALARSPERPDAYAVMGDAFEQLGRRPDAVEAYEAAVERKPDAGEWWYRLGRLRLDANDRDGALAAVTRAAEIGDASPAPPRWLADAHRVKAEVHRLRRERALAERHYERYLALAEPTALDVADVERRLRELRRR